MFASALASIRSQDYDNLEILISDNHSTDGSAKIAQEAAAVDKRVTYIRQQSVLRAFDNFMGLLASARGQYFMWAAHDDLWSPDFVSSLLRGFDRDDIILTFGELEICARHGAPGIRKWYDFENVGLEKIGRIRKQALMQCYHLYGLWRTDALASLPKRYCQWWMDLPLMMAAAANGRFRYIPGPVLRYYEIAKTDDDRAVYQDQLPRSASKLRNVLTLVATSFAVMWRTAGLAPALFTAAFVIEKNLYFAHSKLRRIAAGVRVERD